MNFQMRATPTTETAIGHTSHNTSRVTGGNVRLPLEHNGE
jgi:hypothetical protein